MNTVEVHPGTAEALAPSKREPLWAIGLLSPLYAIRVRPARARELIASQRSRSGLRHPGGGCGDGRPAGSFGNRCRRESELRDRIDGAEASEVRRAAESVRSAPASPS